MRAILADCLLFVLIAAQIALLVWYARYCWRCTCREWEELKEAMRGDKK